MSKQQRLHPATIIFNFIKTIRESLFILIIGFISLREDYMLYYVLGVLALLILIIGISILSWYRYSYRIEDDELRIESGIFVRKKRTISKNRIQSIDLTAGVIHRIFKLVKVQIETASTGTSAEASLQAVTLEDGERLRQELKMKTNTTDEESSVEETAEVHELPSKKITNKRLFLAGTTSGSVGVILAIFAFGYSELVQFIPEDFYDNTVNWFLGLSIVIIVVLAIIILLVLWLLGIAGTMIKYGSFTITKNNEEELFITRGLLEKRQITIPLKRIQAIGIEESIIRQPIGYVTIFAEVAGGSLDKGGEFSTVLFPILKADEVDEFLETFIPDYKAEREELTKLPKRSLKYYMVRSTVPFILLAAGLFYFLPHFSWIPLVLLIISIYFGILRYKDAGYRIDNKKITVRYRILNKVTMLIFHKRIQAFNKKQHIIHQKEKLSTVRLSIIGVLGAGKHYTLKELEDSDANTMADWYSLRD